MIKKAIGRMSRMCDEAWYIFMGTLKLSCAMLLCAFMLLVSPQSGYERTMLAAALAEAVMKGRCWQPRSRKRPRAF